MMKFHKILTWAIVILAVISVREVKVRAQSPMMSPAGAPGAAATDCMTLISNMSDCLTFVEKGSKVSKPDKLCCPELAGMLDSNPLCLCKLLGNSKDLGLELDVSRALKLPSICSLQTPPISLCSVVGIPIGAPTSSEGPSSSGPVGAPTSSAGPSSSVPGIPTGAPVGVPTSSAGPSSSGGMSPEAGKKEASNAHLSQVYVVVALAMALTLLTL